MLGLLFILLNFLTGYVICSFCIPRLAEFTRRTYTGKRISMSPALVSLPLWYIIGAFLMTWVTYFTAYLAKLCGAKSPLMVANAIVMPVFAVFCLIGVLIRRKKRIAWMGMLWRNHPASDVSFFVITLLFATFLMFWTFSYGNGEYRVGWSVFSDFAPHMGMIRSFSIGNNFPTTYSHFAGEDIKYHFLFQFMVGNLELLGLRLDRAFNYPSIICFAGAFCLLYVLAVKLTGKKAVGWIAGALFAFRSSDAVFDFLANPSSDLMKSVDQKKLGSATWKALMEYDGFVGTTQHEDWGLWNLNVYCNQRHLAIGLCALLCMILFLLPGLFSAVHRIKKLIAQREEALKRSDQESGQIGQIIPESDQNFYQMSTESDQEYRMLFIEKVGNAIRYSLGTKEGWLPKTWAQPILLGCILGMCSFFNGACVIGCLCVLFVLAIASDRRLEYAVTAAITIAFTLFATKFFIDGSVVSPKYYFGFLADVRTAAGAWEYIMTLCGILPFVLLAAFVLSDGTCKWIWFAFTAPFILAFTTSLTIDVTVNHKYIMMSLMLLAIPAAYFLVWLWERAGAWPKIVSVLLIFVLTATGLYDLRTVIRKNDLKSHRYLVLREDDPITEWVAENATSQDIFLSPYYSLNNFVMGGAMLYYGWPYYAWSAGYDTETRQKNVTAMYEATSSLELIDLVMKNNIRYIVIDDDARNSTEYRLNEVVIPMTYQKVFEYGNTAIYDTRKLMDTPYVPVFEVGEDGYED